MRQVFIRDKQLHGNVSTLICADVISDNRDVLRVQVPGEHRVREVRLQDTISMASVAGQPIVGPGQNPVAQKQYPGRNSLFGQLERK